ncbi:MAG TPA: orotidine-5'-phosphate decarboxylase [Fredinandcohnia sp.]|nr:orotidine-5'-phosphate decarboxylase [Fredinandcohnia sp.]
MEFREVLEDRIERLGTRLCLGLDPRPAWHPQGVDLWTHCRDVLEACAPYAAAVKPQLAFFEAEGLAGLQVLFRVLDLAREMEIPVILDGKRGDIGSTAEAYARAWLRGERAGSALTVNPYLGRDSIEPFVQAAREEGGAIFCLVRTSNPGADDLQARDVGGHTVAEEVARWIADWNADAAGYGAVGAVVGATRPEELSAWRGRLARSWLLLPGVGAQGAKPRDLGPAFDRRGMGALVAASRAVEYASRDADFALAAADAAKRLRDAIQEALPR